jgi:hypothetical protein
MCGKVWIIRNWLQHFTQYSPERCWLDGPDIGVEYFPQFQAWMFSIAFLALIALWSTALIKAGIVPFLRRA